MFVAEGTLIDDRYEVISSIGMGGMGVVYEAKQLALGRVVALKLLSCASSDFKEEVARFEREAYILSRLRHVNIVQFYAFGIWQNFPYIAMERISGVSLQKRLVQNEPLPTAQIVDYAMQICAGLEHAHLHSVFHRDIKPSNIIISTTAEGKDVVKLIDFGLAKLVGCSVQKLTQTNSTIGSVIYMSPEQCVGKKADARSDIYSLGCLLYHCFTGEPPYSADNAIAVMFQQTNEPVQTCSHWAELPEAVQCIIARCMSKEPAQRYQTCSAVRDDLVRLSQVDLDVTQPPPASRTKISNVGAMSSLWANLRSNFVPAMVIGTLCLAVAFYFVAPDHTLTKTKNKAASTEINETHQETLARFVRHKGVPVADAESVKELTNALHHCAQNPAFDPNVLLAGYDRLLNYFEKEKDGTNFRVAAREALQSKRTTNGRLYTSILERYHRSCQQVGLELPLVNELEQSLTKFPTISLSTKTELSLLLAHDYFRLGREKEAISILDKIEPVTDSQRALTTELRRFYQEAAGLVFDINQRRKNNQSAADSVIDLTSVHLDLGDWERALGVVQTEMLRKTANNEYDLLRLRLKLAEAYMRMMDYQKAEVILSTILKPLEDGIAIPDRPRANALYTETVHRLSFCYLRAARYAELAHLGDRWAQHRDASAECQENLPEEIDLRRAIAHRHLGHLSEAEKVCKSVSTHTGSSLPVTSANYCYQTYAATANGALACVYYRQGNYKAALTHARIGVDLNTKCGNTINCALDRLILMQCLQKLNRTTEASMVKEAALKQLQGVSDDTLRASAYLCDDVVSLSSATSRPLLFKTSTTDLDSNLSH